MNLQTDEFSVIARVLGHGGYAAWRKPPPGHKGQTVYGLLNCGRWAATLGELWTGIEDADLAKFWGKALKRLRKLGLSELERRDIAQQLLRKGVVLPEQPTWSGADGP